MLLLVEDEALVAMTVEEALVEAGFKVETATSGEQAVKLLDTLSAEILGLISDIRLGGKLTGWDVARHARQLHPDLPVVYVSGDSQGDWAAQGVPGSIMIAKPAALVQITTAIAQLLNQVSATR